MFRCKNCGEDIDEYQYNNYNQLCSSCIRNKDIKKTDNPITGKIFQLTAEIDARKRNHWAIWMFLWFIVFGVIALLVTPLPFLIVVSIVGVIGVIVMYSYIGKTNELKEELKHLL